MKRKFIVSVAVDCRVDKEVEAESFEEAYNIAVNEGISTEEWKHAEVIDDTPVNATDTATGEMKDF